MKYFTILFIFLSFCVYGQEKEFVDNLRLYKLDAAEKQISDLPKESHQAAIWQIAFRKRFNKESLLFKSAPHLSKPNDQGFGDFLYYLNLGDYYCYNTLDLNEKASDNYKAALSLADALENEQLISEALKRILILHRLHYLYNNKTYKPFLARYKTVAYDDHELAYFHYFNLILNFKNYQTENWDPDSYVWLTNYFKKNNVPYLQGVSETVFASYFEETKQLDSVWFYAYRAVDKLSSIPYGYKGSRLNQVYCFMTRIALLEMDYDKAKKFKDSATAHKFSSIDLKFESLGYYQQSVIDSANGNYLQAYDQSMKYRVSMAAIEKAAQNNLFNDLEVKYQAAEKERQLIIVKEDTLRNKNVAIALGGILLFIIVISILVYKNTKRKQRIAEQEHELELQKKEKILKNQELTTIDAMIAGQEKERQRLASDLHDSVGATLAAAKLQFYHLSKNRDMGDQTDELFTKTGKLLEDAYAEIRAMAHVKNSGVIAKNGLLPAVQKLAKNASGINGLRIEVEDFGLEERLENSLEITIFRIIQELVTNIIKHSQATEASISINQYEDSLNIIIEDNGTGFNPRSILKKDSMGLSSIEKRIEHIEGTLEIDSTLGKGATILIDIPL
ncbi:sensor histidine kinase [Rasiella sp. SM2506]|uniref:sensor histidine kinase n=1 Tax=Rasiella sp. SM2506 TaxID=3423914 RepID=UPI003D7A4AFD